MRILAVDFFWTSGRFFPGENFSEDFGSGLFSGPAVDFLFLKRVVEPHKYSKHTEWAPTCKYTGGLVFHAISGAEFLAPPSMRVPYMHLIICDVPQKAVNSIKNFDLENSIEKLVTWISVFPSLSNRQSCEAFMRSIATKN